VATRASERGSARRMKLELARLFVHNRVTRAAAPKQPTRSIKQGCAFCEPPAPAIGSGGTTTDGGSRIEAWKLGTWATW
jgi:hypothetical protein